MTERGHIPQPGDVLGGKYEIEGRLGQGGMGLVLAARNVRTNRRVAIKWLLPRLMDNVSALKRFEREAQVAGQINHPNVINVYDIERDQDTLYIVMELLEGEPLSARLATGQPLPLTEAAPIFMGVLRGVAAAHAAGVVHRDLKPDNVFLCRPRDGSAEVPKVLDFGISKLAKGENASTLTQEGALLGTVQYMSPEQLRGHDTDERTDVYALGVILYRTLSGQMPYQGTNHIDLALNMASHEARPLSQHVDVPEGLDAAVSQALARETSARFASVEAFARALEPYFDGHAFRIGEAPGGSLRPASGRRSARPRTPEPEPEPEFERESQPSEVETPFAAEDRPARESEPPARKELPAWVSTLMLRLWILVCIAVPGSFGYLQWRESQERLAPLRERLKQREEAPPPPAPLDPRKVNGRNSAERKKAVSHPVREAAWVAPQLDAGTAQPPSAREARPTAEERRRTRPARPSATFQPPPEPEPQPEDEARTPGTQNERPYRAGKPDRAEF